MTRECYECEHISMNDRENCSWSSSTGKIYCERKRSYINAETHGICSEFELYKNRSYNDNVEIKNYCHNIWE